MTSINITLIKSNNVYTLGERIVGTAQCYVKDRDVAISAIKVIIEGQIKTEWKESEAYYDDNKNLQYKNVTYSSQERCLYKELTLLEDEVDLSAGKHLYPFDTILPPSGLPPTYEGSYGYILYQIKAIVVLSWGTNLIHKIPIEVSAPLDLNNLPHLRNPATMSIDKIIQSCFCRDKGILVFNMSLPLTGFIPGQEIHVGSHVQNLTNVNVESVRFKIIQDLEFIARNPSYKSKSIRNVLATRTEGSIGAHGEKKWTSILKIPTQRSYPNFESCSIMNVSYRLQAKVLPYADLENEIGLVIGGVALTGVSTITTDGAPPAFPGVTLPGLELPRNAESRF